MFYDLILRMKFLNFIIMSLVVILFIGFFGLEKVAHWIDRDQFPDIQQIGETEKLSNEEKGIILLDSISYNLKRELDSTYGWTANDILFHPIIMDNRAYRQIGVFSATKTLLDVYSRVIAKLGNNDRENEYLYRAKLNHFAMDPTRFAIISESTESSYQKGLKNLEKYKKELRDGKAIYNCKTNDIKITLNTITGDQILGYALGLLESAEDLPFYKLDNRIYEVQGMVLVVREVIHALYELYPEVSDKGNLENYNYAMRYMNDICTYDPLWISTNPFNNGALIRSYLLNIKNRIEDIAESLKI